MMLYFVRHGQTDTNANNTSSPATNEPLTSLGIQQAQKLAAELADVTFDAIISSPLKRAFQTAKLVNEYHKLPIAVDDVWRERDMPSYMEMDVWNDFFDFDKNIQLENSETLGDFFERIYAAIDELKRKYANQTVLVVSHGGVQHAVYAYANELPWTGNIRISPMRNCEYRVYDL